MAKETKKGYDKKNNPGAFGNQDTKPAGKKIAPKSVSKKAANKKGGE